MGWFLGQPFSPGSLLLTYLSHMYNRQEQFFPAFRRPRQGDCEFEIKSALCSETRSPRNKFL